MIRRLLSTCLLLSFLPAAFCQNQPAAPAQADSTNRTARPHLVSRPERFMGTVTKVEGTNVVINARGLRNGMREVTIGTDSQTEFKINGQSGKLADLKPAMLIQVTRTPTPAGSRVRVVAKEADIEAVVVKAETTNIVLKVVRPGPPRQITLGIDSNTRILSGRLDGNGNPISPTLATLDDLKPDTQVVVVPGIGVASRITIAPPTPPAPDTATEPATNK